MFIANEWKDYEVIDCSAGEKLERWGDYLLVRPDPQVIWDTKKEHRGWKKMNVIITEAQKVVGNGSSLTCLSSGALIMNFLLERSSHSI